MMNIVKLISDRLNSSIENEGSASLVVSGGSSPIRIYEELSNIDIFLFIIASSIRPNLLVFGLVFLTDPTLKKSILRFLKIGIMYIFANVIFYNLAVLFFPGYTFRKFSIIFDLYFGNQLHFIEWNSSFTKLES